MMRIFAVAAAAALALCAAGARPAAAADSCAPEGKVHYLCGMANVEDMLLVPGGKAIIASGMTGPGKAAGELYSIDPRRKSWKASNVDWSGPARAPYAACPGPMDPAKFAPHGIALKPGKNGHHTLLVVNHGGRESIEVFRVDANADEPALRWIGCVVLPPGASGNAVTPMNGEGFVATKFMEAGDSQSFAKMAAGVKAGRLYTWRPGAGFKPIPDSEMSGANGVEFDGATRQVFANAWPEKRVYRFEPGGAKTSVGTGAFLPDNIHWKPDGVYRPGSRKLLVTGQVGDIKTLLACAKPRCPHAWTVAELDAATMKLTPVLTVEGTDAFSDATVAIETAGEIWVGTYRGDRVAYVAK